MAIWLRILFIAAVLLLAGGQVAVSEAIIRGPLATFAREVGLRDTPRFVDTVETLRATGRLPAHYVSKETARAHGWRGGGLCSILPGAAIGGDVFHNFDGALPRRPTGSYHEADLDSTCKGRGASRLVYDKDRKIYVTVDHYQSFVPVP